MNNFKVLMNGIVKENPTFVLLLGMCPSLRYFGSVHPTYRGELYPSWPCRGFCRKE